MNPSWAACTCFLAVLASAEAEDFLDRLDESLTFSALDDQLRARISGTLDLEYFHTSRPPFAIFNSTAKDLFNPRLSFFVDAQAGAQWYAFIQARVDRGFDPGDGELRMRLDEYALRYTPWKDGRFSIQVGKFSSVIGRWNARHLSWDNPFITPPLPYHQPTTVSDLYVPYSARSFADYRLSAEGYAYLPIIWSAAYTTGLSVSGQLGKIEYAFELKNAALSSRPESWDVWDTGFDHPTVGGRIGFRPDPRWNLGVSASRGPYLRDDYYGRLPRGSDVGDFEQSVFAQDVSFEWHHLQLWAEFYQAQFDVPNVGKVGTFAYFIEGKYRFAPEFYAALRWNQQIFDDVRNGSGGKTPWAVNLNEIDAAIGYRFTPHTQLKFQYSFQFAPDGDREENHMFGLQVTTRF